jgi:NIMA (never in mitosis gene a)-related kinase 2
MAQREEEIVEAVRKREEQLSDAWVRRKAEIRKEVEGTFKLIDKRVQWLVKRENDLEAEETRLNEVREELDEQMRQIDQGVLKGLFFYSFLEIALTSTQSGRERTL